MLERTVSAITLTLLLIGMLTLAFNIQSVRASGTIYIRADGSIDPDTAPISSVDNITYMFTGNTDYSLVISRDNIVVDGVDYVIQWTEGRGITLSGRNNITIKNMEIKGFHWGIWLEKSLNINIFGNNIQGTYTYGKGDGGIMLSSYSNHNNIFGNNITKSYYGIELSFSSNNSISENNITNHYYGIMLDRSSNNSMSGNYVRGLGGGIYLIDSYNNRINESL